jgi:16S rRNA (uracil1498-N3)-methyltransferase
LLIGPEGDFTSEELALAASSGFQKVSLGPNRLRTETAGLMGVAVLNGLYWLGAR